MKQNKTPPKHLTGVLVLPYCFAKLAISVSVEADALIFGIKTKPKRTSEREKKPTTQTKKPSASPAHIAEHLIFHVWRAIFNSISCLFPNAYKPDQYRIYSDS